MSVLGPVIGAAKKKVIHPHPMRRTGIGADKPRRQEPRTVCNVAFTSSETGPAPPGDDMRVMERQRAHLTISRENTVSGAPGHRPAEQRGGNAVEGQDMVGCTTLDRDARHAVDDACLFVLRDRETHQPDWIRGRDRPRRRGAPIPVSRAAATPGRPATDSKKRIDRRAVPMPGCLRLKTGNRAGLAPACTTRCRSGSCAT